MYICTLIVVYKPAVSILYMIDIPPVTSQNVSFTLRLNRICSPNLIVVLNSGWSNSTLHLHVICVANMLMEAICLIHESLSIRQGIISDLPRRHHRYLTFSTCLNFLTTISARLVMV